MSNAVRLPIVETEGLPTWSRERRIGHYGGALDKENHRAESARPFAYRWYAHMQASRGSAYTTERNTLVHCENLAIARFFTGLQRASEKLATNALPVTSDERLEHHVQVLAVQHFPNDTRHELRLRCAAKDKAVTGNDRANVDAAIRDLLGPAFVRCWRQEGATLAAPPPQTFWPVVNPGPAAYDLGGGTWISERSHLVVEVKLPDGMPIAAFLELMNTHLFRLLTFLLPSYETFNWAMGISSGFVLDVSQLDFNGMN